MLLTYRLEGTHTLNQRYNAPFGRLSIALEYALLRRGPMAMGPSPLGIFLRSDQDRDRANLAFTVLPFSRVAPGMKSNFHPFPAITMSVYDLPTNEPGHRAPQKRGRNSRARAAVQLSLDTG